MPDADINPIDPRDVEWHDGRMVAVEMGGFSDERQTFRLTVDLFESPSPSADRKRYCCVGVEPRRILISGDVGRLVRHRASGNLDFVRLEGADDGAVLVVGMFGGMIEVEAARFYLAEAEA